MMNLHIFFFFLATSRSKIGMALPALILSQVLSYVMAL